jgi:Cu(I)/Ag(I) efflux system membrane fusion protein
MTLDYLPGKEWQGQVDYVYPTLDEKTRTVKVRLRFSNKNGEFKPNMFAQVTIHTTGDDNALLIPKEALIRTGIQDRVVLALGDGHFKSIAVKVGRFDHEFVEILSGLSEGEKVVSSAQFLLDSESSKTSDFLRMSQSDSMEMMVMDSQEDSMSVPSAIVTGKINSLMLEHGMLNIARGPIEKWDRAAATVDFLAHDSLDISALVVGMTIEFTFEIIAGDFIITAFTIVDGEPLIEHLNH